MASSINGTSTNSGGLISTGDDSGILNIQTNETTAISISAAQVVTLTNALAEASGGIGTTTGYNGFKNRLINGTMGIGQRATAATNVTLNGPGYTTVDRFFSYQNTTVGVQTSQIASGLSGFQYALKWGRPVSNTTTSITVIGQAIETVNSIDLQGQSVTFSFWAKCGANFSSSGSGIGVSVFTGTGTDQSSTLMVSSSWTGSATPINTSATLTTSWQKFTFTGTFGASITQAGVYMNWSPVGTAGADDNVYITGVQLEKGSTATSFDYRPYTTELELCQRYYEKSYNIDAAIGTNSLPGLTYASVGSNLVPNAYGFMTMVFKVTKRITPTMVIYSPAGTANRVGDGDQATYATVQTQAVGMGRAVVQNISGFTLNPSAGMTCAHFTADSEL